MLQIAHTKYPSPLCPNLNPPRTRHHNAPTCVYHIPASYASTCIYHVLIPPMPKLSSAAYPSPYVSQVFTLNPPPCAPTCTYHVPNPHFAPTHIYQVRIPIMSQLKSTTIMPQLVSTTYLLLMPQLVSIMYSSPLCPNFNLQRTHPLMFNRYLP